MRVNEGIVTAMQFLLWRGNRRSPNPPTVFDGEPVTACGLLMRRLMRAVPCHPICFVAAMIFLDRVEKRSEGKIVLHAGTFRRLLGTALVLANKMNEDFIVDYETICPVLGVSKSELNALEWSLSHALNFDFSISLKTYYHVVRSVLCIHQALMPKDHLTVRDLLALEDEPGQKLPNF